ncbi:MAG: hypothetical protein KGZ64_11385 [Thermaerobacter sp.]|nr:hypothetical protein [Thermaerobacter sp.]
MKLLIKGISLLLTMVLIVSTIATPVAAGRGGRRGEGRQTKSVDAEVRILNGQLVIVVETKEGYVSVPVSLSESVSVNGQTIPLALQGNGVVVPTEDGPIVVPIEEFDVIVANGQVFLVAEENPIITAALFFLGAKLGAKYFPIAIGIKSKAATMEGAKAGAAAGTVLGAALDLILITGGMRP